jgi:uncharacterized membrane protein
MSLESGKHLGKIASLFNIITPVILVVFYVAFFLALFISFPTSSTGSSASSILPSIWGLIIAAAAIAVVGFAGQIMFIVSMHRLSHYYNEPKIFKNVLNAWIINIVGSGVLMAITFGSLFVIFGNIIGQTTGSSTTSPFVPQFIAVLIIVIVAALIIAIFSGVLYMRAFNILGTTSGEDNFKTAGILYLVGLFVPVVGWIAWIMAYIGFSHLQPKTPATSYAYPQSSTANVATKFCSYCGTPNSADALYCGHCGKPI